MKERAISHVRLLQPHGLWSARLLCPWDSPGKNTGVGSHFILQGIFLTQGSDLGLLHCRQILHLYLLYIYIYIYIYKLNHFAVHLKLTHIVNQG